MWRHVGKLYTQVEYKASQAAIVEGVDRGWGRPLTSAHKFKFFQVYVFKMILIPVWNPELLMIRNGLKLVRTPLNVVLRHHF